MENDWVEDALAQAGFGRFQVCLMVMAGICWVRADVHGVAWVVLRWWHVAWPRLRSAAGNIAGAKCFMSRKIEFHS